MLVSPASVICCLWGRSISIHITVPVPWGEVSDQDRPTPLLLLSMLLFYHRGWAFLVSTVFRTSRAIAKRDITLLLGGVKPVKGGSLLLVKLSQFMHWH